MEGKKDVVWDDRRRRWRWRWVLGIGCLATTLCTLVWVLVLIGLPGRHGAALFKWHPILMSLATMVVLPCGIFSWTFWRGCVQSHDKAGANECWYKGRIIFKLLHVSCVLCAFIMMIVGIGIAYVSHVQQGFGNLYSFHSWVGALTIIMMKVNILGGVVVSLWRNASKVIGGERHRIIGVFGLCCAFASVILGFTEYQSFLVRDKGPWSSAAICAAILACMTSIIGSCFVIEFITATSTVTCDICRKSTRTLISTGINEDNHENGVAVIYDVATETREISSGSGTSS